MRSATQARSWSVVFALVVVLQMISTMEASAAATEPSGIALDFTGHVYVADYANDRILKYSLDGVLAAQWGASGSGAGQFSGPFGVSVGSDGSVYVVDQLNNRIQRFGADGTFLDVWGKAGSAAGSLRTPFGVASANRGIYVADFGNDRVQVFSPDGQLLQVWGGRGSAEGLFTRTAGVAVDQEGSVYVSDHFNHRVQKFSADGQFLGVIGVVAPWSLDNAGTIPEEQLQRPEGLAVDRHGNLFVADYGRHRIVRYGSDGGFQVAWGGAGAEPGMFAGPKGLALDPETERVFVADTGNHRIQVFSTGGVYQASWILPPS